MARKFRVTDFVNDAEKAKYEQSLENLTKFDELQGFLKNMHDFYWQLATLYLDVTKTAATPNIWYRLEVKHEYRILLLIMKRNWNNPF